MCEQTKNYCLATRSNIQLFVGWEHVFSGEIKSNEVDGQHDWVRYYTEQKADKMVYDGYYTHDEVPYLNFMKICKMRNFRT